MTTIASAQLMFSVIIRSSSIGGSGTMSITTTSTTTPAPIRSVYLPILFIVLVMRSGCFL